MAAPQQAPDLRLDFVDPLDDAEYGSDILRNRSVRLGAADSTMWVGPQSR
jgi:hypothetical protein